MAAKLCSMLTNETLVHNNNSWNLLSSKKIKLDNAKLRYLIVC